MKKMTQNELIKILESHERWLLDCEDGERGSIDGYDLSGLSFYSSYLGKMTLSNNNLINSDLSNCSLFCADLSNSDLTGAILTRTSFKGCKIDNVKGLERQKDILDRYFERVKDGYICYKIFGLYSFLFPIPESWKIEENSIIENKLIDMDRRENCSYGINVATMDWIKRNNQYCMFPKPIWKCLILNEDLDKVCVPYSTNGKIRCGRLKLLEVIE